MSSKSKIRKLARSSGHQEACLESCASDSKYEQQRGGSRWKFRLILSLVGCVIYVNSLWGDFVYDDRRVILENNDVISSAASSWLRLFQNDFWGTPMCNKGSHKSYRPLVILTFKLQVYLQRLFTGTSSNAQPSLNPIPFHVVNLLLHLFVVDVIFQLVSSRQFQAILQLQAQTNHQASREFHRRGLLAGQLAALLFACHPIHVEAVASIVGRAELMGCLCCLLSFRNLASYLVDGASQQQTSRPRRRLLLGSALCAIATFLCKENHAFSVLVIDGLLVGWFAISTRLLLRQPHRRASLVNKGKQAATISSSAQLLAGLLILYVGLRLVVVKSPWSSAADSASDDDRSAGPIMPKFSILDNPLQAEARQFCLKFSATSSHHQEESANDCLSATHLRKLQLQLTLTRLCLPALNLVHLLWPNRLSYDWSLESIGLIESLLDGRLLAALATYASLVAFASAWLRQLASLTKVAKCEKAAAGQDSPQQESEAESETSDTSSVKSASTTKSFDSGFVDCDTANNLNSLLRQQPKNSKHSEPRDHLPLMNSLGWSLVWLLVPLVPVSNLLFWVGFIMAERTLYLPSLGFCLLAANVLVHLLSKLLTTPRAGSGDEKTPSLRLLLRLRSPQLWRFSEKSALIFEKSLSFFTTSVLKNRRKPGVPPQANTAATETWEANKNKRENNTADGAAKSLRLCASIIVFPLLIWGGLKTMDRNSAWLDERSLYSSNLAESPTKSLANLASLTQLQTTQQRRHLATMHPEQLYRLALEREPLSADLHYNLARALHGRAAAAIGKEELDERESEEVAYHYKLALELRQNFALAALNLGAYQYAQMNQLDLALRTFEWCGGRMRSDETKTRQKHVRVQIECLISGAKLRLTQPSAAAAAAAADRGPGSSSDASGEQTTNKGVAEAGAGDGRRRASDHDDAQPSENCPKVLELMHKAKSLMWNIGAADSPADMEENTPPLIMEELEQLGDPARQMALIHWLSAKCSASSPSSSASATPSAASTSSEQELSRAVEWADRSQVSLDAQIYLDYADSRTLAAAPTERAEFLSSAIERQKGKLTEGRRAELAKLHHGLAKVFASQNKLDLAAGQMDEAIGLKPDEAGFLSFGAQLAFDLGRRGKSEHLYWGALKQLRASAEYNGCSPMMTTTTTTTTQQQRKRKQPKQHQHQQRNDLERRIAQAHTNYGAILQVNGRPEEARQQYRQALDCDPANSIAKRNLARL